MRISWHHRPVVGTASSFLQIMEEETFHLAVGTFHLEEGTYRLEVGIAPEEDIGQVVGTIQLVADTYLLEVGIIHRPFVLTLQLSSCPNPFEYFPYFGHQEAILPILTIISNY